MTKGDWRKNKMVRIGPDFVASRQTTRQLRRQNMKKRRRELKEQAAEQLHEDLLGRAHRRQQEGKRPVQWPSWWHGCPESIL